MDGPPDVWQGSTNEQENTGERMGKGRKDDDGCGAAGSGNPPRDRPIYIITQIASEKSTEHVKKKPTDEPQDRSQRSAKHARPPINTKDRESGVRPTTTSTTPPTRKLVQQVKE